MAITSADLKAYLTGAGSDGGAQASPAASLGDYRSSTEYSSNTLFDDVSSSESLSGDTEYRCICMKNEAAQTLYNAKVYISAEVDPNADQTISFAVEVPTGGDTNGSAQSIVDESTSPNVNAGNVSDWSSATTYAGGVAVNINAHDANLDTNEIIFVWVRRVISASSAAATCGFTLKLEGDTGP